MKNDTTIVVRVPSVLKSLLQAAAAQSGTTLSKYIKLILEKSNEAK